MIGKRIRRESGRRRQRRLRERQRRIRFEPLESRFLLAAKIWDGGGDGVTWNQAANWDGDVLPGPADDVFVDVPAANPTITLSGTSAAINSLMTNEAITVSGVSLTVSTTADINANLMVSNATLRQGTWDTTDGSLIFGGTSRLDGATMQNEILLENNDTVEIYGGTTFPSARLTSTGSSQVTLSFQPGSTVPGNVFTDGTGSGVRRIIVVGNNSTLTIPAGVTIHSDPGSGRTYLGDGSGDTFINEGVIESVSGELRVVGRLQNDGLLDIDDSTLLFQTNSTWLPGDVAGVLQLDNAILDIYGNVSTASFNVSPATFQRHGGQVLIRSAINNTGDVLTLNATTGRWTLIANTGFSSFGGITGGKVDYDGERLEFDNPFNTQPIRFTNVEFLDQLLVEDNDYVQILGTTKFPSLLLAPNNGNNGAVLEFQSGLQLPGDIYSAGSSSGNREIRLIGNGSLTIPAGVAIHSDPGSGRTSLGDGNGDTFINQGEIQSVSGELRVVGRLQNDGLLDIDDSTLLFQTNSTWLPGDAAGVLQLDNAVLDIYGNVSTASFNISPATFQRHGGQVLIRSAINNTGNVLTLNATTGRWTLLANTGFSSFAGITGGKVDYDGERLEFDNPFNTQPIRFTNVEFLDQLLVEDNDYVQILGTTTFPSLLLAPNNGNNGVLLEFQSGLQLPGDIYSAGSSSGNREIRLIGNGSLTIPAGATIHSDPGSGRTSLGDGSGDTFINQGKIQSVSGELRVVGRLQNDGLLDIDDSTLLFHTNSTWLPGDVAGVLQLDNAVLDIYGNVSTASFNISPATFQRHGGQVLIRSAINNTGNVLTLNATTGRWTLLANTVFSSFAGINGGKVDYDGERLEFDNPFNTQPILFTNVEFLDQLLVEDGDFVQILGNTTYPSLLLTASGNNTAIVEFQNGSTIPADIHSTGTSTGIRAIRVANNGSLTIPAGVTIHSDVNAGRTEIGNSGDTIINQGTLFASRGTLTIAGSSFTNNGIVQATANALLTSTPKPTNFSAGTLTAGTWLASDQGIIRVPAGNTITTNAGTIRLDGPNARFESGTGTDLIGPLAVNDVGGSLTLANGRTFSQSTFDNRGELNLAATTFAVTNNLVTSGAITVDVGSLLDVGGMVTQSAGRTIVNGSLNATQVNLNGGVLGGGIAGGSGRITSNVINTGGTVNPGNSPGILDIIGNYTQGPGGTLLIDIAGRDPDIPEFDRLRVTGIATLDGTLRGDLLNDFEPTPGDAYRILSASARLGQFAIHDLPYPGGFGRQINPEYDSTGVTLLSLVVPPLEFVAATTGGDANGQMTPEQVILDRFGNSYVTGSFSGMVDFDREHVVAGDTITSTGRDGFVAAYDPNGQLLWVYAIDGLVDAYGSGLAIDHRNPALAADDLIYITGGFAGSADYRGQSILGATLDAFLLQVNASGGGGSFTALPSGTTASGRRLALSAAGNPVIAGEFTGTLVSPAVTVVSAGSSDAFVMEYAIGSGVVRAARIGGAGPDRGKDVAIDSTGAVWFAGDFAGTTTGLATLTAAGMGSDRTDAFLLKLTPHAATYSTAVARGFGAEANDTAAAVSVDGSNHVVLGGEFQFSVDFDAAPDKAFTLHSSGDRDTFLVKLDAEGAFEWARAVGGYRDDRLTDLTTDAAGSIYATGLFTDRVDFDPLEGVLLLATSSESHTEAYLSKLDENGSLLWAAALGDQPDAVSLGSGLDVANSGRIVTVGQFQNTVDFDPTDTVALRTFSPGLPDSLASYVTLIDQKAIPEVQITGVPGSSVLEGATIPLATSIIDPDSIRFDYSWTVTRGDELYAISKAASFPLQLTDQGIYTIHLVVKDESGNKDEATATIVANNAPPIITSLSTSATSIVENDTVTVSGSFSDPGVNDAHTVVIEWNDGSAPQRIPLAAGVRNFSASHRFLDDNPSNTSADLQSIRVRVQDNTVNVLAAKPLTDSLHQYEGTTINDLGTLVTAGSGGLATPSAVAVGPNGDIYVSNGVTGANPVLRFDGVSGTFLETFIPAGTQGTTRATDLAFGPDGNLYYLDGPGDRVLRFAGRTGDFLDVFVAAGLTDARGLAFGPDGDLYIADNDTNSILQFDGETGALTRTLVSSADGLEQPLDVVFGGDNELFVLTVTPSPAVLRFDASTGESRGTLANPTLSGSTGHLLFGSDNALYVADPGGPLVRYDTRTGTPTGEANTADGALAGLPLQAEATTTVTITNAAPVVTVTAAPHSVPGEYKLQAQVRDTGTLDTFTYSWSVTGATVVGSMTASEVVIASPTGAFTATLTVTDDDASAGTFTTRVQVGTPFDDTITVTNPGGSIQKVIVYALAGDDTVDASAVTTVPVELIGGLGNDVLTGGSRDDILLGNSPGDYDLTVGFDTGNDTLTGNAGNDLLDGGMGDDTMIGGTGNDTYIETPGSDDVLVEGGSGFGIDTIDYSFASFGITFGLHETDVAQVVNPLAPVTSWHTVTIQGDFENLTGSLYDDVLTGNRWSNILRGGGGSDTLYGGDLTDVVPDGNDTLIGGTGDDLLIAGAGDDVIYGGDETDPSRPDDGNDVLIGGSGNDLLVAGAGDDVIYGGDETNPNLPDDGNDILIGGSGNDLLIAGAGDDVIYGGDETNASLPDDGNDVLIGGAGNDRLIAGAGDDVIYGGDQTNPNLPDDGNDVLIGGAGNDLLIAGAGDDVIYGGDETNPNLPDDGNDVLIGGAGNDRLIAGAGDDVIYGGDATNPNLPDDGDDVLIGGAGNDRLIAGAGDDVIYGGDETNPNLPDDGDDVLIGGAGNDRLIAGAGDDVIYGGDETNPHLPDEGNDILIGGAGDDLLIAGAGDDVIYGGDISDPNLENDGDDTLIGGAGNDILIAGAGDDVIYGGDATDPSLPSDGDDILVGGTGNDLLIAGAGDDVIFGGAGNDTLTGNEGQDLFEGGSGLDRIVETLDADMTLTPTRFIINGTFSEILFDIESATLIGGASANVLDGSLFPGPVLFLGLEGNDTLIGGGQGDQLYGGAGDDFLQGNGGDDLLDGGSGNDTIDGGPGNDSYLHTPGSSDLFTDSQGIDSIDVGQAAYAVNVDLSISHPQVIDSAGNVLTLAGTFENFRGTSFNDIILGTSGRNIIVGAGGIDVVDGREGADTVQGSFTQLVYLDFDSATGPGEKDYTVEERNLIQARLEQIYGGPFSITFTQTRPPLGRFTTIIVNAGGEEVNELLVGGAAAELDWRNFNPASIAAVNVNPFLGRRNQPAASSANFVNLTTSVVAHELGHLLGLRHSDAFGPIGMNPATGLPYGISSSLINRSVSVNERITGVAIVPFSTVEYSLKRAPVVLTPVTQAGNTSPNPQQPPRGTVYAGSTALASFIVDAAGAAQLTPLTSGSVFPHSGSLDPISGILRLDWNALPAASSVVISYAYDAFRPGFLGPDDAFETNFHVMASPASVGSRIADALGSVFLSERSLIKAAFADASTSYQESDLPLEPAPPLLGVTARELGNLPALAVPNMLPGSSVNYGQLLQVRATSIVGSIDRTAGGTGPSENDIYTFTADAGDILTVEVLSTVLRQRFSDDLDAIVSVHASDGSLLDYYGMPALNDDGLDGQDPLLIDIPIPASGRYYIVVDTFAGGQVPDDDTGSYELFIATYRVDSGPRLGGGGDILIGGADADVLIGSTGDDRFLGDPSEDLFLRFSPFDLFGPANVPPVAVDDQVTIRESQSLQIDVLADNGSGPDFDDDGNLDATLTTNTTTPLAGVLVNNHDGTFSFDPNGEFESLALGEVAMVSFTYQIEDSEGETDSAVVTITIEGENDAPRGNDDDATATENGPTVIIDVLANDVDIDNDDDATTLRVDLAVPPTASSGSTVTSTGCSGDGLIYSPDAAGFDQLSEGDSLVDVITYYVLDSHESRSAAVTVSVTVTGINDVPVSKDVLASAVEDGPTISGSFDSDDIDDDDDPSSLIYEIVDHPAEGTVDNKQDGTFEFSPGGGFQDLAAGESRLAIFSYRVQDRHGTFSNVATVTVTVSGANDDPVVTSLHTDHDSPCGSSEDGIIELAGTFTDRDLSDSHTVTIDWGDGSPFETQVIAPSNSSFGGVHEYDQGGIYSVRVTVADMHGGMTSATTAAVVQGVGVVDGTLYVIGSNGRDKVHLKQTSGGVQLKADFDHGTSKIDVTFDTTQVNRLMVFGCDGDDHLHIQKRPGGSDGGSDGNSDGHSDGGPDIETNMFLSAMLFGGKGDDLIRGGQGNDFIDGGEGDDHLFGEGGDDTIVDTSGDNRIRGGFGNDSIQSGDGDDDLDGQDGDDSLIAGNGRNKVNGGNGNDLIVTGSGRDDIDGGNGNDRILAGSGDDKIDTGNGNDLVIGGDGKDVIKSRTGRSLLVGGRGADEISAKNGSDILIAGFTDYDDNLDALNAVMAEWTGTESYEIRVANVIAGGGSLTGLGVRLDESTVHDDQELDVLDSDQDLDLFFYNFLGPGILDKVKKFPGQFRIDID